MRKYGINRKGENNTRPARTLTYFYEKQWVCQSCLQKYYVIVRYRYTDTCIPPVWGFLLDSADILRNEIYSYHTVLWHKISEIFTVQFFH